MVRQFLREHGVLPIFHHIWWADSWRMEYAQSCGGGQLTSLSNESNSIVTMFQMTAIYKKETIIIFLVQLVILLMILVQCIDFAIWNIKHSLK